MPNSIRLSIKNRLSNIKKNFDVGVSSIERTREYVEEISPDLTDSYEHLQLEVQEYVEIIFELLQEYQRRL